VKHAVRRGIWVPTQHLLWDQGNPRGPGSYMYIPHEQGGPVIPPGSGLPEGKGEVTL
jgi:hypothetical protein